jgi:serine/threonine protein kinase
VLEYYPLTLSALLHAPHKHLLTPRTFLTLATQLSHALAHCHANHILHTDLKPANVLLAVAPEHGLQVRLGDFGSALHLPSLPNQPTDPAGLGTLSYSPPEFFRPPPSPFSLSADVFSAGVTLGAALFSREPYSRLGPRACRQWVIRGAYWAYEESERIEASAGLEMNERWEYGPSSIGTDAFEKVLERPCTHVELASLVPPSASPPPPIQTIDTEPYADGSIATYFPGIDEQINTRRRIPEKIIFLLKRMCEPVPEMRPSMEEVASEFESIALDL